MSDIETRGIRLPRMGFGTFLMTGDTCRAAVESALSIGYRHIDTAARYENEADVGAALAESTLPRSDIHVTTKVWHDQLAPDAIRRSMGESLRKLRLDHVDLFLIHWPAPDMDLPKALETLMALKEEGLTRAIGVANFTLPLLKQVVEEIGAPIACNQIEYHVYLDQTPIRAYLAHHGIAVTAYCPIAKGEVAQDEVLKAIAQRHGATPAQVALRWLLDQGEVAAIPKAAGHARQAENFGALSVTLDAADHAAIAALPKTRRYVNPAFAPVWDAPAAL